MDSFNLSLTYTATVKFTSSRSCFVFVPDEWLSYGSEIHIFKLIYGENKEAFVSCLKIRTAKENIEHFVEVNAKFAEKLGLKEKEKVCLQPLLCSIPKAQRITIEPLTSDDWEMLDLNAKLVEQDLMNQIRTVWINQVFPIWANRTSFFVKIVETEPKSKPLLLEELTEVHVVPKGRYEIGQHADSTEKYTKKKPSYLQFDHLRNKLKREISSSSGDSNAQDQEYDNSNFYDSENKSATARALSYFSAWFSASNESFSSEEPEDDIYSDFEPLNLNVILRVVPYTTKSDSLPLVMQATTVFISACTYAMLCGTSEIPPCFVAVLQKYSPWEYQKPQNSTGSDSLKREKELKSVYDISSIGKKKDKNKNDHIVSDEREDPFDSVCVTVMVIKSADEDEFGLPHSLFYTKNLIVVPKELKRCLNLEVSSLVHLKYVQAKPVHLSNLVLHPITSLPPAISEEIIFENFSNWAFGSKREHSTYVLSDGTLLTLRLFGQKYNFFINLQDNLDLSHSSSSSLSSTSPDGSATEKKNGVKKDPNYGYLSVHSMKRIKIKVGRLMCLSILVERPYLQKQAGLYQEIAALQLKALGGVSKIATEALETIEFWLKLRPLAFVSNHPFTFYGCMLLFGPKGVGKSALANAICKKFVKHPHHVFIRIVQCLPLKGKRVESIAKKWNDVISEAIYRQPSLVLFEDLDYIASCPASHEQEAGPDGVYFASISQTFIHMINKIIGCDSKVAVLVTAQSTHSLHPTLIKTKGRHIFQSILEVQPPNAEQRAEILHSLVYSKPHISDKTINSVPWAKLSSKTEGFVAQDLNSLVDRATHAAWVRLAYAARTPEIALSIEDFEMALEGYVPSSLRGIPLQMQDPKTWNDVGGLREVKKVIQQIIMWPVKYKQIFKNYSLKPQTNVLLYGAPGTGKTLLAGVIASECGLNFISIKGPELLSKYIGASEQAIRDLFKRASAARPCILFFDEFDSIAPRRGHDSTGVTDRVVNQLLTQLDGVESLEGVHVLAATSRPELIDPALLRPGRLDKCLHCPLPDKSERLEILMCLSSKLPVCEDVDFEVIASKTEYFSGADLQALLYTSHIEALHDTQITASRKYSTSSEDLDYNTASDKLLYMPTVQDGITVPSFEDGKKIVQEVNVIQENFCGIMERRPRRHSTLIVSINHGHILKVANEMKPSVSAQERKRYETVFKNFESVLSGDPITSALENIKRVTLA